MDNKQIWKNFTDWLNKNSEYDIVKVYNDLYSSKFYIIKTPFKNRYNEFIEFGFIQYMNGNIIFTDLDKTCKEPININNRIHNYICKCGIYNIIDNKIGVRLEWNSDTGNSIENTIADLLRAILGLDVLLQCEGY